MAIAEKSTTVVSTNGRVILPQAIRDSKKWGPGQRLEVRETSEGVLLKPQAIGAPTKFEDVFGCLGIVDHALTDEEMDAAVLAEARRRYGRD